MTNGAETVGEIAVGELGDGLSSLRLCVPAARERMLRSLRQLGQVTPVQAYRTATGLELFDGLKRLQAARELKWPTLRVQVHGVDGVGAKVRLLTCNVSTGISELEEGWVVRSLYREEGLTQPQIGMLAGRDKSWVCRRLSLVEDLVEIARSLRIGRNTVRGIRDAHREAREGLHTALPVAVSRRERPSKLEPFRKFVVDKLKVYPDITAERVYEDLREVGFDGGRTVVKELVRRLRAPRKPTPSLETPPRVPGEMAECDWSEYPVTFTNGQTAKLQAFGYTLRYSTRKYFSFHEHNDIHALMAGHVAAFDRFQGATRQCKYDGQKPVVLRREERQPIYNLRFVEFATYYEFQTVACPPRSPNHKGYVSYYTSLGRSVRPLRARRFLCLYLTGPPSSGIA